MKVRETQAVKTLWKRLDMASKILRIDLRGKREKILIMPGMSTSLDVEFTLEKSQLKCHGYETLQLEKPIFDLWVMINRIHHLKGPIS